MSANDVDAISEVLADAAAIGVLKVGGWRVDDAVNYLITAEPRFVPWIQQTGLPQIYKEQLDTSVSHFASLFKTIVCQQVSVAAGKSILGKVLSSLRISSLHELNPECVRDATWSTVMVDGAKKQTVNGEICGLSESKIKYVRDLAQHFLDPSLLGGDALDKLEDDELMKRLIEVKGLGTWSVHMFMLFKLQRPDVLALGDLGIRRGIAHMYSLGPSWSKLRPQDAQWTKLTKSWSPFSSLACALMWKSQQVSIDSTATKAKRKLDGSSDGGKRRRGSKHATV